MRELPPEWLEFIDSLTSNRVRYLIVGAHALAVHGRPRDTQDIDFFVEPTVANAKRLALALRVFGYPALADEWRRFAEPDRMATLGVPPRRIDVMTSISGVSFASAWRRRVEQQLAGRTVCFLGLDALIANKRASARYKDIDDVETLTGVSVPIAEVEAARARNQALVDAAKSKKKKPGKKSSKRTPRTRR